MDISVIVPCLNEQQNIPQLLKELEYSLSNINGNHEIIIIDDQSDDETYNVAVVSGKESSNNKVRVRVLKKDLERRGYGAVIKFGIAHANGKFVTFISADLVDPLHKLKEMYTKLEEGADLVQCSRYTVKTDADSIPFKYKFYQYIFRGLVKFIFRQEIDDSTYSFKMFRRSKILSLGISSNRFNISPEIFFKAILANYNVKYVNAGQGVRLNGESKFNFKKEAVGYLNCLIRAYLHSRKIVYWF